MPFLSCRYLVLYQYGGIYTDMDAAPGPKFENATAIRDDDEAWFVVERIGIPSQYFMASAPKHPLMHLLVTVTLRRLLEVQNVGEQYVPLVTGPGALKEAWQHFIYHYPEEVEPHQKMDPVNEIAATEDGLEDNGLGEARRRLLESYNDTAVVTNETQNEPKERPKKRPGLESGVYVGMLNWTVTIAGNRGVSTALITSLLVFAIYLRVFTNMQYASSPPFKNTRQFVNREAVKKKKNHWKAMGMRHFQHAKDYSLNMTCYERIYQEAITANS
jgi:Glycosyltransferase sugar-binding region containing DXD motif